MAQPPATPKPRKPNRPANLPHGRWLGDLGPLSEAEQKLVECCAEGQICLLNNDKRPEEAKPEYTIRAELVRFLALGGDSVHPIHERGIMLAGAWIANALDIDSGTVVVDRGGSVCLHRDWQRISGSSAGCFLELPIWGVMQGGRSPTGVMPHIGGQIHAAIASGRLSKYV